MSAKDQKKSRLGRGLNDLSNLSGLDKILPQRKDTSSDFAGIPLMLDTEIIDSNPDQPRQNFNEKELESLAKSIKAKGIIEPLVVNRKDDGRYELIAGERRLRAAKMIGHKEVPVILRKSDDSEPADRLILALLENLCRENLNPIEEAESFYRLEKDFGKTHQEIATMSGRERPTISNAVRLLKLPEFIRDDIKYGRLSAGHGRAMLGLSNQDLYQSLRSEVLARNLSVRQTEALVRKLNRNIFEKKEDISKAAFYEALEKSFTDKLGGMKVKINYKSQNKKIEIFVKNNEDIEWLMNKFGIKTI